MATTTSTGTTVPTASTSSTSTSTTTSAVPSPAAVVVSIRIDDRVGVDGFAAAVTATLTDPRGWQQAGFAFRFGDPAAPYTVVLAEGPEVDALCLPYDTGGRFSCQNGPVVALNADRWRAATDDWPADLATYREMLVNHEVGHLLGQHHPDPQCPVPDQPAPVLAQQSSLSSGSVAGCLPNPWPLPWELECAARHVEPLAPPYEADPVATCDAQR